MNILIVDDDPHTRGMLFQLLHGMGHEVSVLANGHNAVSLLADPQHGVDLVFLDLEMPRLTGDKVIEVIKDIVQVHFVIVTGNSTPKLPNHIQIIEKPFDLSAIEQVVYEREKDLRAKMAKVR